MSILVPSRRFFRLREVQMASNFAKDGGPARVLIAEDEPFIAFMLEDVVTRLGFEVLGPFASVSDARCVLESETPSLALLDVNLLDGEVYPLADILYAGRVPLIFHTGNTRGEELKYRYEGSYVVYKPSSESALRDVVVLVNEACRV